MNMGEVKDTRSEWYVFLSALRRSDIHADPLVSEGIRSFRLPK